MRQQDGVVDERSIKLHSKLGDAKSLANFPRPAHSSSNNNNNNNSMKFATCLALTAVAIASATADDCAFLCPLVHDPVGDENGNMYSNECFMMLAKCQAGKATASPVTSHSGSSSVEAGNNCPDLCTDEFKPVTDEHGNLYSNECYMRQAKCQDKKTGNNNPAVDPALTLRNID